jgi:hypothetical protein
LSHSENGEKKSQKNPREKKRKKTKKKKKTQEKKLGSSVAMVVNETLAAVEELARHVQSSTPSEQWCLVVRSITNTVVGRDDAKAQFIEHGAVPLLCESLERGLGSRKRKRNIPGACAGADEPRDPAPIEGREPVTIEGPPFHAALASHAAVALGALGSGAMATLTGHARAVATSAALAPLAEAMRAQHDRLALAAVRAVDAIARGPAGDAVAFAFLAADWPGVEGVCVNNGGFRFIFMVSISGFVRASDSLVYGLRACLTSTHEKCPVYRFGYWSCMHVLVC